MPIDALGVYLGQTLFSQVMQLLSWMAFSRVEACYGADRRVGSLNCAQQFRTMALAQRTKRRNLRLLASALGAVPTDLYHAGFTSRIHVSTLAGASRNRFWRIHAALAQRLINRARALCAGEHFGLELDEAVHPLDSSTVDLCRSVFRWA